MSHKLIKKEKDEHSNVIELKNTNNKKEKLTKKQIILRIIETILILCILAGCVFAYAWYDITHHGYKTSDKVINQCIYAIDKKYTSSLCKCFDDTSNTYTEFISVVMADRDETNSEYNIDYDNIEITSQDYNNIDTLKEETGNDTITEAKNNTVIVPSIQTLNNEDATMLYYYQFITYKDKTNKWFVHKFKLLDYEWKDDVDATLVAIGDDIVGYIYLPSNWTVDDKKSTDNSQVVDDITYKSINSETVSLIAMTDISSAELIANVQKQLSNNNMTQTTTTNSELGEYKTTMITGVSNDGTTTDIIWIFSTPLHDKYTHYIEISCLTKNSTRYIDYITSFTLN